MKAPLRERFEKYVDRSGGPDACHPWTASTKGWGYGQIGGSKDGKRWMDAAHRVAFQLGVGPIPAGLCVLHHCDNPCCCNPRHLFLGTHADNMADKTRKGRASKMLGKDNPHAKLSESEVLAIRGMSGTTQREIGKLFGVSQSRVSDIRMRVSWGHL